MRFFLFSVLINIAIFSFLPLLHYFFHEPVLEIEPIKVDVIKLKKAIVKPKKKQKPEQKRLIKTKLKPEVTKLMQRITFELTHDALSSEVDLIVPQVTYGLDEVDQLPELIEYVEPEYPEEAIAKGIEGVVVLKILINEEGGVEIVKVLDNGGFYKFAQASSRAVKKWLFRPAKIMGMPVSVWCIQKIRFELKDE